jgi:hypothetical protein
MEKKTKKGKENTQVNDLNGRAARSPREKLL